MANTSTYFNTPDVVIPVVPPAFTGASGVIADPDTVTCVVTDPVGDNTTYTYSNVNTGLNVLVRNSAGKYELDLQVFNVDPAPPTGLWHTTWVGSGTALADTVQVFTTSFRVIPLGSYIGQHKWYVGLEEFKSRNSSNVQQGGTVLGPNDDYEISRAISVASGWINRYCGTHFYQVTEARTYPITNIYYLPIDQIVPGSITSFAVDYDGDGIFETQWLEGQNYQVYREGDTYNRNYAGIARPFDYVKVVLGTPVSVEGGEFFPFVWPFTHDDRVQITGTWGWPEVPDEVSHACMIMATQIFKEKDSPWGIVGVGDMGAVKAGQSPFLMDLLRPFINPRMKVGI